MKRKSKVIATNNPEHFINRCDCGRKPARGSVFCPICKRAVMKANKIIIGDIDVDKRYNSGYSERSPIRKDLT